MTITVLIQTMYRLLNKMEKQFDFRQRRIKHIFILKKTASKSNKYLGWKNLEMKINPKLKKTGRTETF